MKGCNCKIKGPHSHLVMGHHCQCESGAEVERPDLGEALESLDTSLNKLIGRFFSPCNCHCHTEKPGAKCRCIKNCIHCRPENFSPQKKTPTPTQKEQTKIQLDHVKREIVAKFPELMAITLGCRYTAKNRPEKNVYIVRTEHEKDFITSGAAEILGHPITLEYVLKTMMDSGRVVMDDPHQVDDLIWKFWEYGVVLDDQSPETIEYLFHFFCGFPNEISGNH